MPLDIIRRELTAETQDVSVPEAVRQTLTRNYPVYQTLKMKVVNFHSLAELIQPTIKEITRKNPSINTLVVAIKRFSDTLDKSEKPDVFTALDNARISLTSGIVDLTIKAPKGEFSKIVREISDISTELSDFPHIFPLATSIKIIMPKEDYDQIKKKLGQLMNRMPEINAAKLTLQVSSRAEMKPGIASYVTELLYRNGVNIYDAFLGYEDIIIVVDEQDGPHAYGILQGEIRNEQLYGAKRD